MNDNPYTLFLKFLVITKYLYIACYITIIKRFLACLKIIFLDNVILWSKP